MKTKELNNTLKFIESWQKKNVYDPLKLYEFNAKFKKDLSTFLEQSNFKTITLNDIIAP